MRHVITVCIKTSIKFLKTPLSSVLWEEKEDTNYKWVIVFLSMCMCVCVCVCVCVILVRAVWIIVFLVLTISRYWNKLLHWQFSWILWSINYPSSTGLNNMITFPHLASKRIPLLVSRPKNFEYLQTKVKRLTWSNASWWIILVTYKTWCKEIRT